MKRLAVGALFVSLLAGSVAMAGQGFHGNFDGDRGNSHSDNRGGDHGRHDDHDRRDPPRQNGDHGRDDHGRNDWNRGGGDRSDWDRGHDRRDWNGGNGRRDWDRDRDRHDWNGGNGRRDWNQDRHDWNGWNGRRDEPRYYSPPRYYAPPRYYYSPPRERYYYGDYRRPYGYYSHSWARGERLPSPYYSSSYVVYDYDRCGLRRPPYGYHWVRVDRDVVLAAVASGVILDVIYNQFY